MNAEVIVDTYWLNLALGVVLPMVVALVTKQLASGRTKTLVLLALSVIATVLQSLVAADGRFVVSQFILYFLVTMGTAITSHFGVLQPLEITGKNGVIQESVPGGIGRVVDGEAEVIRDERPF